MARKVLKGIPVSSGIAIGKAFFLKRGRNRLKPRLLILPEEVSKEVQRLDRAIEDVRKEMEEAKEKIPGELKEYADVLHSHLMILRDEKLFGKAKKIIAEQHINAEWAIEKALIELEKIFTALDNEYIKQRMQDIQLVAEKVCSVLIGFQQPIAKISQRGILLAHDLDPTDTILLELDKIMAFATVLGGKTSHAGIIARSLQIPAIVGVEGLEYNIRDGQVIILDGFEGKILISPTEDELANYNYLQYKFEEYQSVISRDCHLPASTTDGFRIHVLANIELFEEVTSVIDYGGEGIGLYRSEYSFLNKTSFPEEEEIFEEYRDLASIMYPRPVVIRTLDLGADKVSGLFEPIEEVNPALGLRGIRFCQKYKEIFRKQLRAILRAGVVGNISVMFPMISGLHELIQAKKFFKQVQKELKQEGLDFNPDMPLGIMIEIPSAVLIADLLAKEVDFFSIGTNDLIQYALGIDRSNKYVSYLYQPLHPAIIRSIKHVLQVAKENKIKVSVCGEMSSDPFCVPVLLGMGIDSLSLSPQAIPGIKKIIRQVSMEKCKKLVTQILESGDVLKNNKIVRDNIFSQFPEELTFFTSLIDEEKS
ncbi:MAG: phosphoenolpyruvate--protein phosphotransferase [Desulfonauticus sp.]|nr:phosphoenolpyruvate--protein phosphotransferase [Desulfonauticus sp.]